MKSTEDFYLKLNTLKEQKLYKEPIFQKLFERISKPNFHKLLNHAIQHKEEYINKKYCYYEKSPIGSQTDSPHFLYCSYEIYLNRHNQFMLNILTKNKLSHAEIDKEERLIARSKTNNLKPSGRDKSGSPSFLISSKEIVLAFSTGSHGKPTIQQVLREGKIINLFNNPFIGELMIGQPITKRNGKTTSDGSPIPRLSTCGQLAKCDGNEINFKRIEDLWVAITSLALALEAISIKKIVHQDLKLGNILLLGNGIIQIIDFGLATLENDGSCNGTASFIAPELLAEIADIQRLEILESCKSLSDLEIKNLNELPFHTLSKQIAYINSLLNYLGITPKVRYKFHCIDHVNLNGYSIAVWDHWYKKRITPPISTLNLPNRKQDLWSFGYVLYQLIKNSELKSEEKMYTQELSDYVKNNILASPPSTRIDIKAFLLKLNVLIGQHPSGSDQVNFRIKQHIQNHLSSQRPADTIKERGKKRTSSALSPLENKEKIHKQFSLKSTVTEEVGPSITFSH